MSSIDLDNPTDEQRLIVELYERTKRELDVLKTFAQRQTAEYLALTTERDALRAEVVEARRVIEEQARRITIFVMDQRRQLAPDVLIDIADSHTARDRATARAEKAEAELAEWGALAIRAEAMKEKLDALDAAFVWPPTGASQVCGWCVHAAGDTKEAWESAERYTLEDMRRHTRICENNPIVVDLLESRTINRTRWRENAERDTAEAIAAWLDVKFSPFLSVSGTDRQDHDRLVAGIRQHAWKPATSGEGESK